MTRRRAAFTLIEVMLAITIAIMILVIAIPSVSGMSAERRLIETFERFDKLARTAQFNAVSQQRSWVLVWAEGGISLQPDEPTAEERANDGEGVREDMMLGEEESLWLERPASLLPPKETPGDWTFWRSGTCEPVFVNYRGPAGDWRAQYNPLTGMGEIVEQVLK